MAKTGQRREAYGVYYFVVEIEGERFAHFRSATGLKSEAEVVPMSEGGWNAAEHKLVGRTKYPNIVLKQGAAGPEMWRKRQRYISDTTGDLRRFDGAVIQMGPGGKAVAKMCIRDRIWPLTHNPSARASGKPSESQETVSAPRSSSVSGNSGKGVIGFPSTPVGLSLIHI